WSRHPPLGPHSQQTALKAAFDYFAIPNSAIPFYCYRWGDGDYLYTTLENPEEGSQTKFREHQSTFCRRIPAAA
ncbi:MAG: hypothetical protein MN733_37235, partial [Nitrososphaera sp.]|nr:hypothetical protein [Nitrososphaera sp.]